MMRFMLLDIQPTKDLLLASDKIFSVMAVLLVIFGALIGYVYFLNKKVKAIEAKIDTLEKQ